jgi:hypothetical protein
LPQNAHNAQSKAPDKPKIFSVPFVTYVAKDTFYETIKSDEVVRTQDLPQNAHNAQSKLLANPRFFLCLL